ncbi:MAG: hypothetical protein RLZZ128_200 [Actinomycetota bacterium]
MPYAGAMCPCARVEDGYGDGMAKVTIYHNPH